MAFTTARKLFGVTNVWTLDGNINIKLPDGKRRRVFSHEEVMVLGAEHGKSIEADTPAVSEVPIVSKATTKTASPVSVAQASASARPKRNVQKK